MSDFARAVEHGIDNRFITWADGFGNDISRLSTSQIRNVFGSVKRMEMAGEVNLPELLLLKPKLAYAARRRNDGDMESLKNEICGAIDAVDAAPPAERQERFRRFCQGFEAILAYHRAHGGK